MASLLKKFEYAGKEGKPAADAAAKELRKSKDFVQRRFAITALGTLGPEALKQGQFKVSSTDLRVRG